MGVAKTGFPSDNFQSTLPVKASTKNRFPPSVVTNTLSPQLEGPEKMLLESKLVFHINVFVYKFIYKLIKL